MSRTNPKVDAFLREAGKWRAEMTLLREFALQSDLTEELKWRKPCYTLKEGNVIIIQAFKDYCALMFCKGSLLKDPGGLLAKPGEHTQAARQLRFTSAAEITRLERTVKAYISEAVEAEKAGLEVKFKTTPEPVPEELRRKFSAAPALKRAFARLTPGRQRAYILFISAAKQSQTRESRIEKCAPQILRGKGMND
jgi:uncharacterized protein YdeI (YjbR/CyaY-like superfamily)